MSDSINIRNATIADLSAIVALLADDSLGATREVVSDPVDVAYVRAFAAIEADANQQLIVAERGVEIVGCLQLSFVPGLSRRGMWRGQIEGVRIASGSRGEGLGHRLLQAGIDRCRERDCQLVQLTTDKLRPDALRFYESIGFVASHEGLKRSLELR